MTMGPGSIVVQAHSKTGHPYRRGDRVWTPEWQDHCVDEELLALIKGDPHIDVRDVSPHEQAAKKEQLAREAEARAAAAEETALTLRIAADALRAEANAASKKASAAPAPKAATPYHDAMRAASPAASLAPEPSAKRK